jgi:hypothetical protein
MIVRGFEQPYGKDYVQTCVGIYRSAIWKIGPAMAALKDWDIHQMDAVAAFLNSPSDRDIYMELPPMWQELYGINGNQLVCKLYRLYTASSNHLVFGRRLCAQL